MRKRYRYVAALVLAVFLASVASETVACSDSRLWAEAAVGQQAQQEDVKRMEKELLGPYHNTSSLTAQNLRHAYIIFLENVNDRQSSWTSSDWGTAQVVMNHLNDKYGSIYVLLSVSDKAKIKALQAEFLKLQQKSTAKK